MDIILIRRKGGQARGLRFNHGPFNFWMPLGAFLLAAVAGLLWTGYQLAPSPADEQQQMQALMQAWQTSLSQGKTQLADTRKAVSDNVDALSLRLARLQAEMLRIDALGQHLVKEAGLDPKAFDFSREPAEGGPETGDAGTAFVVPTMTAAVDNLSHDLNRRAGELQVLQDVLMHKNLRHEEKPSGRPIKHGWLTSLFGTRIDPFTGKRSFHPGMDFAAAAGSAVLAVASGIVTWAGPRGGYGNLVQINDGNGYQTRYGDNEKILVRVGDKVHRGEKIALMGSTGRSTGPHVHLEVRHNGRAINPAPFVKASR
jgi:murein DD-endopeptidase MepM/ murein hydrolase activator NlpD